MNKILIFGVVALLAAVSVLSPAQAGHTESKFYTGTGGGVFIICLRDEGQCYGGATFSADRDQIHEGDFVVYVSDSISEDVGGAYRIITKSDSGSLVNFCNTIIDVAPSDVVGLDVHVFPSSNPTTGTSTAACETAIPTTGTITLSQ